MILFLMLTLTANQQADEQLSSVQPLVLAAVNEKRARSGLFAYRSDARLQRIAEKRCREMALRNSCSHFNVTCAEGIGCASGRLTNKQVRGCWVYSTSFRRCGAAMFYHNGRTYYCMTYGR
jgi:uncharacterized protein YkwD